ncbi:Lsr2 family protein [Actinomadura barringtoniae]|uniref:Lsr2 family protein n=2 Tax=Actinomadura barringtoniae TaxID=1427535 RepID=A0A939TDZ1_9ACTN|nr:Lsr2 family protein [Actinomadura barringtoniae]
MGLVATALWSPGATAKTDLAERLLASEQDIDAALQNAQHNNLLHVTGDASTPVLAAVDRRSPEERDPARRRSGDIRAWAKARGIKVNEPGHIPLEIAAQFQQNTDLNE